jgi:hypothetical protein
MQFINTIYGIMILYLESKTIPLNQLTAYTHQKVNSLHLLIALEPYQLCSRKIYRYSENIGTFLLGGI